MGTGTELGRVRGLGSAKEGAHHWWRQRVTAGTNLLLMLWFIVSVARLPAYAHADVTRWVASPWVAIPLVLLIVSVFTHFRLGLQVVIEDYQHDARRIAALILLNVFTIGAGATAIFAILRIALTGTPK
ncbi:succinate dehydrogenase subunit D [Sphingomonas guangdongensis]|uniref:Succinate dehydrogenase hydrophobic membrane anchor subunit n=1 Tax=Sphingomonas guangdongensis TaxID=1141890 RepID=A0A285QB69_9SPHN|nr:succinate dehydrogenase, hydrophobic membrane anchor protein [Sphingomonas guangdongensis]SOB78758.1 succinate dehydrogenase subunit D [Sphingomonas guangdongensis]